MVNANYILGNKKQRGGFMKVNIPQVLPKKSKVWSMPKNMMGIKSKGIQGYKNMPQARFIKVNKGNDVALFKDSDKDRVINGLDCFPYDPKRHGLVSWVKSKFSKSEPDDNYEVKYPQTDQDYVKETYEEPTTRIEPVEQPNQEIPRAEYEGSSYEIDPEMEQKPRSAFQPEYTEQKKFDEEYNEYAKAKQEYEELSEEERLEQEKLREKESEYNQLQIAKMEKQQKLREKDEELMNVGKLAESNEYMEIKAKKDLFEDKAKSQKLKFAKAESEYKSLRQKLNEYGSNLSEFDPSKHNIDDKEAEKIKRDFKRLKELETRKQDLSKEREETVMKLNKFSTRLDVMNPERQKQRIKDEKELINQQLGYITSEQPKVQKELESKKKRIKEYKPLIEKSKENVTEQYKDLIPYEQGREKRSLEEIKGTIGSKIKRKFSKAVGYYNLPKEKREMYRRQDIDEKIKKSEKETLSAILSTEKDAFSHAKSQFGFLTQQRLLQEKRQGEQQSQGSKQPKDTEIIKEIDKNTGKEKISKKKTSTGMFYSKLDQKDYLDALDSLKSTVKKKANLDEERRKLDLQQKKSAAEYAKVQLAMSKQNLRTIPLEHEYKRALYKQNIAISKKNLQSLSKQDKWQGFGSLSGIVRPVGSQSMQPSQSLMPMTSIPPSMQRQQQEYDPNLPKYTYQRNEFGITRKSSRRAQGEGQFELSGTVYEPLLKSRKSQSYPWTKPMKGWSRQVSGYGRIKTRGRKKGQKTKSSFPGQVPKRKFTPYVSTFDFKGKKPKKSSSFL